MGWKPWSAGIDWLTVTAKRREAQEDVLRELARSELTKREERGELIIQQKVRDYQGWKAPHFYYGWRDDSVIVVASSADAHPWAMRLKEELPDVRATRIDIENSWQAPDENHCYAREAFDHLAAKDFRTPQGRQITAEIKVRHSRGDTLYVGAPSSARRTRFYHKSAEQLFKIEPRIWRGEIQHNEDMAPQMWARFVDSPSVLEFAHDVVFSTMEAQGCDVSWIPTGNLVRLPTTHHRSDPDKVEDWVKGQVTPAVAKWVQRGHGAQMREATAELTRILNGEL